MKDFDTLRETQNAAGAAAKVLSAELHASQGAYRTPPPTSPEREIADLRRELSRLSMENGLLRSRASRRGDERFLAWVQTFCLLTLVAWGIMEAVS